MNEGRRLLLKKLLALLLLLCMLPALPAQADLPLVYPEETVLCMLRLTDAQRRLAEVLYTPVLAGEEKIPLPEGTRYKDVGPAMQCLMLTYPELFHLGRSYTISYWQNEPDKAISVSPEYRMDARRAGQLRGQLYEAALEMIAVNPTAVGLHDALVARVTYGGTDDMRHTAVGALLEGKATCEGYSQALTLLYRMAGIPCGIITGVGVDSMTGWPENHSWNIINLGGYSLIDATWNDQEGAGLNTYWYFGLSSWQMAADHTPGADMSVPVCGDHAGWHVRMGACASSMEEVYAAVQRLAIYGTPLNLRITDAALYRAIVSDPGAVLDGYNDQCPEGYEFYGRYSYLFSDAQQCIIMQRGE